VGWGGQQSEKLVSLARFIWYFEIKTSELCTILFLCISDSVLCIGSEWHRFPSSFFIPDYVGQVQWIDDGFRGLLPFPFNSTLGGTAAAPPYFNDKNMASDKQYVCPL